MDASPGELIYQPARRQKVGVLIMFAGPSGSGKTLSALHLARGLAGPQGKIAFADTENDRALYYAAEPGHEDPANDRFEFSHLSIGEPFRPAKFEAAAVAAQQQHADVWICDSFSHEHVGPGGLLDFHEDEMKRMVAAVLRRDPQANEFDIRDRMKAAAWIEPKGEHKHMLQRLWQLNANIILCCQAEKKIALVKVTEGKRKGKTDWIDQGFQPICGPDIPYAMTMSFMFDVKQPGVPIVIKPLMKGLVPLIDLKRPIDIATGQRIAEWASGSRRSMSSTSNEPATPAKAEDASGPHAPAQPASEGASPAQPATPSGAAAQTHPRPENPGAAAGQTRAVRGKQPPTEAEIEQGARHLAAKFATTKERRDHLAIVDDADNRKQLDWLRRHRRPLYTDIVEPVLKASWDRTGKAAAAARQQAGLPLGEAAE